MNAQFSIKLNQNDMPKMIKVFNTKASGVKFSIKDHIGDEIYMDVIIEEQYLEEIYETIFEEFDGSVVMTEIVKLEQKLIGSYEGILDSEMIADIIKEFQGKKVKVVVERL